MKEHKVVIAFIDSPVFGGKHTGVAGSGGEAGAPFDIRDMLTQLTSSMFEGQDENDPRRALMMIATQSIAEIAVSKRAAADAATAYILALAKHLPAVEAYERARYDGLPSLQGFIDDFAPLRDQVEKVRADLAEVAKENKPAPAPVQATKPKDNKEPDETPDENDVFFTELLGKLKNGPKN